jgi:hypothetical protein
MISLYAKQFLTIHLCHALKLEKSINSPLMTLYITVLFLKRMDCRQTSQQHSLTWLYDIGDTGCLVLH